VGPTQPSIQWVASGLTLGVKRPRREADRSSSRAELNGGAIPSSPIRVHGVVRNYTQGELYLLSVQGPASTANILVFPDPMDLGRNLDGWKLDGGGGGWEHTQYCT
jgi:hypothetical protein